MTKEEICENCGHLISAHAKEKIGKYPVMYNECFVEGCSCTKFIPQNHSPQTPLYGGDVGGAKHPEDKEPEDEVTELLSMPSGSDNQEEEDIMDEANREINERGSAEE